MVFWSLRNHSKPLFRNSCILLDGCPAHKRSNQLSYKLVWEGMYMATESPISQATIASRSRWVAQVPKMSGGVNIQSQRY